MMPREELIEKMSRKILDAAMYNESSARRESLYYSEQPYWTDLAEAALQALLESLPAPDNNGLTDDGCDVSRLYRQLLEMRK